MKIAAHIAATLLGLIFIAFSLMVLLGFAPKPQAPPGSALEGFLRAFGPTGWLILVKVCELAGGILVIVPKTRNFGLLILGPIIINILAFHILIAGGAGLVGIPLLVAVLALFLLVYEGKSFLALLH